jgi:DNA ligase-1
LFQGKDFEKLFPLEKHLVNLNDPEDYKKYLQFNKDAIVNGFEGVMIKDPDAFYECKRSHHMLKAKPFIEVTLSITDIEEGTGRNQGRLGAFVCNGTDDGKDIRVNVGSGFSDAQRDEFWADRDKLLHQLVEVRGDAVTQNQDGSYSIRFPRFKTFRGFAQGEKI